ncbi:MAG: anhydro-N-acetylmuramic acid kinase [Flavobacteriales bacterium]
MSGTSLDGVDVAICHFADVLSDAVKWELVHFQTIEYPAALKQSLAALTHDSATAVFWHEVAQRYAHFNAQGVSAVLAEVGLRTAEVDLVSSSGQTLHHRPDQGWTAQLDSPAHLHGALDAVPVVADLRALDVALGGQGAPLVPLADRDLFPAFEACLNLGGFSNISSEEGAKDIGPCNLLLNHLAAKHWDLPFDSNGHWAAQGTPHHGAVEVLFERGMHGSPLPKSLSREWLESVFLPVLDVPVFAGLKPEDQMATAVFFVARTLAEACADRETLVTGGGAHNSTLWNFATGLGSRWHLPTDARLVDGKEAVAWAYLGLLRALGHPNVLTSVTGAAAALPGGSLWGVFPK